MLSTPQHIAENACDSLRARALALNINRAPEKIGMKVAFCRYEHDAVQEPRVSPDHGSRIDSGVGFFPKLPDNNIQTISIYRTLYHAFHYHCDLTLNF